MSIYCFVLVVLMPSLDCFEITRNSFVRLTGLLNPLLWLLSPLAFTFYLNLLFLLFCLEWFIFSRKSKEKRHERYKSIQRSPKGDSHFPDAAFFTLCAGLISQLQNIMDNDFNTFVSVTQEVVDLDNTFGQSLPPRPPNNRNNRGQGGQTRPPNTNQQQQQQSGLSVQQSQPYTNPMTNVPAGQPHRDEGQPPNNAYNARDGGRSGNCRNDHSN